MEIEEIEKKKTDMIFRNTRWVKDACTHFTVFRNIVEFNALMDFKISSPDRVLDIGAGIGRITKEFAKSGAEIIALDYSIKSLKANKVNSGVQAIAADMCYLPFKSSIFNKVMAISVLQYVSTRKSRVNALKEIKRVLKPKSHFLMETYNYRPLYDGLIRRRKDDYHHSFPVHYHRFSYNELKGLLLLIFPKVKLRAILVLNPIIQGSIGNIPIFAKSAALLDELISRSIFSWFFAEHLMATCEKTSEIHTYRERATSI